MLDRKGATVALVSLVSLIPVFATAQQYTVTDLGTLAPADINIVGQVVGDHNGTAGIWTSGHGIQSLGILGGGTMSSATAINDLGIVTGVADGPGVLTFPDGTNQSCPDMIQPFTWTKNNGMHGLGGPGIHPLEDEDLCTILNPYFAGYSSGINDLGQIVGSTFDVQTYKYGFIWSKSKGWQQFEDEFQTAANAINNLDNAVGQTSESFLSEMSHAAMWVNGSMTDLGSLGGDQNNWFYCSGAYDVSDLSVVVGWSNPADSSTSFCLLLNPVPVHAFLWQSGAGMQDLGTLPGDSSSVALKVNLFGQVIGTSGDTVVAPNIDHDAIQVIGRPFVWTANNGMRDLNTLIPANSSWVLNSVAGINIWGQIVGQGTHNGHTHGFLLTPIIPNGFLRR